MEKSSEKNIRSRRSRVQSIEEKILATRKALEQERTKMLQQKHGIKKAAQLKEARTPESKAKAKQYIRYGSKVRTVSTELNKTPTRSKAKKKKHIDSKVLEQHQDLLQRAKRAERIGELTKAATLLEELLSITKQEDNGTISIPSSSASSTPSTPSTPKTPSTSLPTTHGSISPSTTRKMLQRRIDQLRRRADVRASTRKREIHEKKLRAKRAIQKKKDDEEKKIVEEARRAEIMKKAEDRRREKARRIAERKKREAEKKQAEAAKIAEDARIAAEMKAAEEARLIAVAKAIEDARLAQIETERLAKIEADRLIQLEADRLAQLETDRLAKIEMDRLAKIAENARLAQIEKDRLAKIEMDRLAKIETDRLAKIAEEARLAQIETDRLAKIETDRLAKIAENARLAQIETDRLAEIETERLALAKTTYLKMCRDKEEEEDRKKNAERQGTLDVLMREDTTATTATTTTLPTTTTTTEETSSEQKTTTDDEVNPPAPTATKQPHSPGLLMLDEDISELKDQKESTTTTIAADTTSTIQETTEAPASLPTTLLETSETSETPATSETPETTPALLMLVEASNVEESNVEESNATIEDNNEPTETATSNESKTDTNNTAAIMDSPVRIRYLDPCGFTMESLQLASEGKSRKNGGLNKFEIGVVLETHNVSSDGTRKELNVRLKNILETCPTLPEGENSFCLEEEEENTGNTSSSSSSSSVTDLVVGYENQQSRGRGRGVSVEDLIANRSDDEGDEKLA